MKEQGWDVHVITNKYPRHLSEQDYLDGIEVIRYSFFHSPLNYIRNRRLDLFFAWLFLKPLTLYKLIIHFIQTRPDVVNLHFPDHQLFECYLLKYLFRFKLVISLHGNEVERLSYLKKTELRYKYYKYLFKSSTLITGCSKYLINKLKNIYPNIDSEICMHLYNGVNKHFIDQHVSKSKNNVIFAAGRFEPVKGFDLLINAFNSQYDLQLFIAGGEKQEFLNLGLELKEGISIIGKLSAKEIAAYMSESKITVIPSRIDSYGIVVAEALCCGSPVVATNVGGIPEVIALAKKNLNSAEKIVFNSWVRLVDPEIIPIRAGINEIGKNYASIEKYIKLIPKLRQQFSWQKRLIMYNNILNNM